ncbi:MAG: PQQ-dependent sugar dehydrogenase [Patescibacteria group bacterium]|nr:PQQ-dependent sugar dehydrogenase [Patescibacteria group bacterium]
MKKLFIIIISLIVAIWLFYFFFAQKLQQYFFQPTEQTALPGVSINETQEEQREIDQEEDAPEPEEIVESENELIEELSDIEVVATDLQIPWEIAWLPSGEMLVTQRPGSLLLINSGQTTVSIEGVSHVGEGGLQGMALDPDFSANQYLYLYLTGRKDGSLINRVERYQISDKTLLNRTIIIDDLPGAQYHDGGRIAFGPDGRLYIAVGDAGQANRAQELDFLGGKILRINKDGSIPDDNPFVSSPVYSYGHRNPQGLAWDNLGRLWATEHGRSGATSGYDELNLIQAGGNYGWPIIQGGESRQGMISPVIQSGASTTWAPAGLFYYQNRLFFAGLRGESLYEYNLETRELKYHFFKEFGRLRAVALGPDGHFYLSTSNQDGRGQVRDGDDKVIRINPAIFN